MTFLPAFNKSMSAQLPASAYGGLLTAPRKLPAGSVSFNCLRDLFAVSLDTNHTPNRQAKAKPSPCSAVQLKVLH